MLKIIKQLTSIFIFIITTINCVSQENNFSEFTVTSIRKNVYSIVSPSIGLPTPKNKGWNSNSHFVVTKEGVLLFDTGSSESIGNNIKKAIKSVTNLPVRWIINSHSHADHWLGNVAFKNTAVTIIASNETLKTMKKYGEEDVKFYAKVTKGTIGSTQLMYPTKILTQNQKFNFGGIDVEFIFSNNGHSPGDIMMWLPKQKVIFGGDVLSSDWMPLIVNPKTIQNLINTLNSVAKLKPSIVLVGHGKATTSSSIYRDVNLLTSVWEGVKTGYKNGTTQSKILIDLKTKMESTYASLYKNFDSELERYVKMIYNIVKK